MGSSVIINSVGSSTTDIFFFSIRRRHTRYWRDWSSDVCSSDLFVFVFFGLVAVVGTTFAQTGSVDGLAVAAAVPIGLLSVALLVVNNLRDIEGDAAVGKRTLAVLLGDRGTRVAFALLPAVA